MTSSKVMVARYSSKAIIMKVLLKEVSIMDKGFMIKTKNMKFRKAFGLMESLYILIIYEY